MAELTSSTFSMPAFSPLNPAMISCYGGWPVSELEEESLKAIKEERCLIPRCDLERRWQLCSLRIGPTDEFFAGKASA